MKSIHTFFCFFDLLHKWGRMTQKSFVQYYSANDMVTYVGGAEKFLGGW